MFKVLLYVVLLLISNYVNATSYRCGNDIPTNAQMFFDDWNGYSSEQGFFINLSIYKNNSEIVFVNSKEEIWVGEELYREQENGLITIFYIEELNPDHKLVISLATNHCNGDGNYMSLSVNNGTNAKYFSEYFYKTALLRGKDAVYNQVVTSKKLVRAKLGLKE